jgi:hypothetical protein
MPKRRPEDKAQAGILKAIKERGVPDLVVLHIGNGGYRRPIEAMRLKGLGVLPGAPDLLIVAGAHPYFLEVKPDPEDGRGTVSDAQKNVHARLKKAGATTAIVWGAHEGIRVLEQWGLLRSTSSSLTKFSRPPASL